MINLRKFTCYLLTVLCYFFSQVQAANDTGITGPVEGNEPTQAENSSPHWEENVASSTRVRNNESENSIYSIGNQLHIHQQGTNQLVYISQIGDQNTANIQQYGANNESELIQSGTSNSFLSIAHGDNIYTRTMQQGNSNKINQKVMVDQMAVDIVQQGNRNVIVQEQYSETTRAVEIVQRGNDMRMTIQQTNIYGH